MNKIKFNGAKLNKKPFRLTGPWFTNVARSMRFTVTDVVRDMVPSTFETVSNGTEDFKSAFDTLKDLKNGGLKKINKNFNEIDQIKSFKGGLGNAIEDLKTGNLYNKKREEKALGLDFDDFDFDDDGFDMDFNIEDSDMESDTSEPAVITSSRINAASSEAVAETVAIQTEVLAKSIQGSAEVSATIGGAQLNTSKNLGIVVGKGLQSINENLSLLVAFNNQTMNAYVGASLKYYEDTIGTLGKILESQTSLLNASQAPPTTQNKKSDKITIEDLLTDGINFGNIKKILGQNIKEFAESNMFMSTAKMFWDEKDGIAAMMANPIGNLMKMGIKSAIPQFLKESLGQLDNTIKNFVPALFMKANRLRDRWDNPLLQMFGELFGATASTKKTFSISNYNNGPTPFDGETKKAITEIIPTYLRKILAAITDSDELVYDHKVNKFKTFTQAREDVMSELRRERVSPFSHEINNMMRNSSFIKFPDYASEKEFINKMEDFFIKVSDSDALLNLEGTSEDDPSFFNRIAKQLKIDKLLKKKEDKDTKKSEEDRSTRDRMDLEMLMSSMTYDEQRLAKLMIDNLEKNKKIELFSSGVIRSRANAKKYFENLENDPNKFLLNQIFNDVDLDKTKGTLTQKYSGGASTPDKFGNSTLSYLRNIQDILVRGIRVFTVNAPSADGAAHLDKYISKMDGENKKDADSGKNPKIKPSFTPEDQEAARANGEYKINDAGDLYDVSDDEISSKIKENARINREKENGGPKKSFIRTMINSMLKGDAKNNFNAFADKVGNFFKKPLEILDGLTRRIDNTLYSLLFGGPEDDTEGKSLIGSIGSRIKSTFMSIKDWTINNIFTPLKDSLFGKDGIISQIKDSKFYDSAKNKFSKFMDYAFGNLGADGFRENGLFTDTYNSIKDVFKGFAHQFTGKEYKTSKGETVKATDKSVFGEIKNITKTVSSAIKTKFFGEKDEDGNYKESGKGFITKSLDALHEGFSNFSTAIFGTKKFDERKTGKEYIEQFKEKLPKSLAWGAIGTGMGLFSGVGLLGGLFLPSGPFGMGLLAASAGMLSQSEKFKNWMFGEKDSETNERIGGIVNKSTQDFLKKNKIPIVAGAGIGAIKGLIGGAGFLPSLLVGGPIGGAMMGMATAIAMKSKTFNNFLFGKTDADGNKISEGVINKFKKSFNFKIGDKDNKFGNIGAGMLGGVVLSKVVGQFGLLGGMMTMGGSPLFGALAGAAAGISLSSEKWRKAIFGEIDEETGKRKGGVGKIANWLSINIGRPLANKIEEAQLNLTEWFTLKIGNPILKIIDPLAAEIKFMATRVETMFKKVLNTTANTIKSVFTDYIGNPLTNAVKKTLITPMGKFFGSLFRNGTKLIGGAISLPFSGLNMLANGLEGRHQRRGIKIYKQGLDEDYRETRNARKFRNNQEEWRKRVQKRKGVMSDEEWEEYSDKYSNMKKPGRLKTFAKKYFDADARREARYGENGAYYSENGQRKSKFKEMIDKQKAEFAKQRQELEAKKEQESLRAEYAKHYGYDNFSKDGQYKGWIYDNDVRFERGKDGSIKALRDIPETKLSLATDGIKSNTDTMITLLSDIRASVRKEEPTIGSPKINLPFTDVDDEVALDADWEPSPTSSKLGKIINLDNFRKKKEGSDDNPNENKKGGIVKNLISSFNTDGKESQKPDRDKLKSSITALARTQESEKLNAKRVNLAEQGNVINQTAKIKMLQKEKAEGEYKTELLDNIIGINKNTAEHAMAWQDIFGKKGLITLALLAFMPVISKFLGWILDKLGITDGASSGSLFDLIEDPTKRTMTDEDGDNIMIQNATSRERIAETIAKPVIKSGLKENGIVRLLGKGVLKAGSSIKESASKLGVKIANSSFGQAVKEGYETAQKSIAKKLGAVAITGDQYVGMAKSTISEKAGKVVSKIGSVLPDSAKSKVAGALVAGDQYVGMAKDTIKTTTKKVSSKITSVIDDVSQSESFLKALTDLISKFFASSSVVKKLGQSAAAQSASQICKQISQTLTKSVLGRFGAKVSAAITKATAKGAATLGTAGIVDAAFAAWDLSTGAFEASNLFMVSSDRVDAKMRTISAIVKALFGFSFIGPLIDLASEIFEEVTGVTLKTNIASIIYKLISSEEKAALLDTSQASFKADWEEFTKTEGNSNVSLSAYNDLKNRTVFQKFISDPISKLTGYDDKSVRKNTGIGATAKITGANRAASVIGKVTSIATLGIVKADKAGTFVNKIFNKILGRNKTETTLPKDLQAIEDYNNIVGATEQERISAAYNYLNNLMDSLQATYGVNSWEEIPQDVLVANGLEQILEGEVPDVINEMFGINGFEEEGTKYVINEDGSVTKHRIEDIPNIGEYTIDKDGKVTTDALKEAKKKNSFGGKIKSALGKGVDKAKELGSKLWEGTKKIGSKVKDGVITLSTKIKDGATKFAKWTGSKAKETAIGGFWSSSKVRENLNLHEDVDVTLRDRIVSAYGNLVENVTGGKVDSSKAAHTINGAITLISDKASEWWTEKKEDFTNWVKDTGEDIKQGFKTANDNLGALMGFTDDEGNSLSLTEGVKYGITQAGKNVKEACIKFKDNAVELWNNGKENFIEWKDETWENFKTGLSTANDNLGALMGFTDDEGNSVSLTEGIQDKYVEAKQRVKDAVVNFKTNAADWWEQTKQDFHTWKDDTAKKIKTGIEVTDKNLGGWLGMNDDDGNPISLSEGIKDKYTKAKDNIATFIDTTKTVGQDLWRTAKDSVTQAFESAVDNIKKIPDVVDRFLGSLLGKDENGEDQKLSTWVKKKFDTGKSLLNNLVSSVKNFFGIAESTSRSSSETRNNGGGQGGFGELVANAGKGPEINCSSVNNCREEEIGGKGPTTSSVNLTGKMGVTDRVNNFAYYAQGDSRWGNYSYGLSNGKSTSNPTMAARACGPTSMAMVVSELNGRNFTPVELADFSRKNGFSVEAGTSWGMFDKASKQYGLNSKTFNSRATSNIRQELQNNRPVILSGQASYAGDPNSPFTKGGHFVVAVGTSGNKVLINDPRGKSKSKAYDIAKVARESAQGWSFGGGNSSILPNSSYDNSGSLEQKVSSYMQMGQESATNYIAGLGPDVTNNLRKQFLGMGPEKSLAEKIVDKARTAIGLPYVWGGSSPSQGGMDCSGLCQWAYGQCGVSIPRVTYDQIKKGKRISNKSDLKPGDLIFSRFSSPGVPEHVVCIMPRYIVIYICNRERKLESYVINF